MAFSFDIIENYGTIEENENSNWGVCLTRISWNGKPPVYDLRKFDLSTLDGDNESIKMSKGVTISKDESMDNLVHLLIENGFGDVDEINNLIKNRDSIFEIEDEDEDYESVRHVNIKRK